MSREVRAGDLLAPPPEFRGANAYGRYWAFERCRSSQGEGVIMRRDFSNQVTHVFVTMAELRQWQTVRINEGGTVLAFGEEPAR